MRVLLYGDGTVFPNGRPVWLVRNADGGVTVLTRDFPGASRWMEVEDSHANRLAGGLPAEQAMAAHAEFVRSIYG